MLEKRPACRECGYRDHWLGDHLIEEHSITIEDYLLKYPEAPLASQEAYDLLKLSKDITPKHPPPLSELKVRFAGVTVPVNYDVPESACLPIPPAYRVPEYGLLLEDVSEAAIHLSRARSTYIWGPQGTGKDAFVHAYSGITRTPGLMFQMEPSADIRAWFFSHEFNKDGTFWQEGSLLKALREGYKTSSGRRIPYLILITDFDRAVKEQAESLRLVLDSIEGRVKGPGGVTYSVLPGTMIVVTANTAGGGDATGRYVSANVIDSSILDRFQRAIQFHAMDWRDEEIIVRSKSPTLVEHCPNVFAQIGKATGALRAAVAAEQIYAEFSHRAVCAWCDAASDIISVMGKVPDNLLQRAFRVISDKMPDKETQDALKKLADSHLKGGTLPNAMPIKGKK